MRQQPGIKEFIDDLANLMIKPVSAEQVLDIVNAACSALAEQNGLMFTPLSFPELGIASEQQPDSLGCQQALPVSPSS